jgi:hypothetical protein
LLLDPEVLARLDLDAAVALRREAARLTADLDAVVSRGLSAAPKAEASRVLGVKEAAAFLACSVDALHRKHRTARLGYVDSLDRRLKFTAAELERYVARQGR